MVYATALERSTTVGVLSQHQKPVIAMETLWTRWVFAEEDVRKMQMQMEFATVKMIV